MVHPQSAGAIAVGQMETHELAVACLVQWIETEQLVRIPDGPLHVMQILLKLDELLQGTTKRLA